MFPSHNISQPQFNFQAYHTVCLLFSMLPRPCAVRNFLLAQQSKTQLLPIWINAAHELTRTSSSREKVGSPSPQTQENELNKHHCNTRQCTMLPGHLMISFWLVKHHERGENESWATEEKRFLIGLLKFFAVYTYLTHLWDKADIFVSRTTLLPLQQQVWELMTYQGNPKKYSSKSNENLLFLRFKKKFCFL